MTDTAVCSPKHPDQPLMRDSRGIVRFKQNSIVRFLLDAGPFDLNNLQLRYFEKDDWDQFMQLIGYSVSAYGDLDFVDPERIAAADTAALELQ